MINLSNRELTDSEILLLKKGLKFTPAPKSNTSELRADVNVFCRKLRLTELLYNEDEDEIIDEPLVRNKTGWNPPRSQDQVLEETIQMIKDYPMESKNKPSNLSKDEQLAVRSLAGDSSIVIKEADKGGAVVIMDADYYKDKITEMSSDEQFYSEIDFNMDMQTRKLINKLVDKHGKGLHKEEAAYLTNFQHETSYFYGLPKIHKS